MDRLLRVLTGNATGNKTHSPVLLIGKEVTNAWTESYAFENPARIHSTNRPRQWRRHHAMIPGRLLTFECRDGIHADCSEGWEETGQDCSDHK